MFSGCFFELKKISWLRVKRNSFSKYLKHILLDVKVLLFFTILAYLGEMVSFSATHIWPEGTGESYKTFWAHDILYLRFCKLKVHAKMSPPLYRPNFVQKPPFLLILGSGRLLRRPWAAGDPQTDPQNCLGGSILQYF